MKTKFNKAKKFLGEIGVQEYWTLFGVRPCFSLAANRLNNIWLKQNQITKNLILQHLDQAFVLKLPQDFRNCIYKGTYLRMEVRLDELETKLIYAVKDFSPKDRGYPLFVYMCVYFHMQERIRRTPLPGRQFPEKLFWYNFEFY